MMVNAVWRMCARVTHPPLPQSGHSTVHRATPITQHVRTAVPFHKSRVQGRTALSPCAV